MGPKSDKIVWSSEEKRELLEYIRERVEANLTADEAGYRRTLLKNSSKDQAARATLKIIRGQVSAIVQNARLDKNYTPNSLWLLGPVILDLNNDYLEDVYSTREIQDISGTTQAGTSKGGKRKAKDNVDQKKRAKRSKSEPAESSSESDLSDPPETEEETQAPKASSSKQRGKRVLTVNPPEPQIRKSSRQKLVSTDDDDLDDAELESSNDDEEEQSEDEVEEEPVAPKGLENSPGRDENPFIVPKEYLKSGVETCSIERSKVPEDIHDIYLGIMTALDTHLTALNIYKEQPVLIKDRAWDDDLRQLMQTVFGMHTTAEQLAKDFATIQSVRVLPLFVFLKSLCAAAVMEWVFRPHPLGFHNDSRSRDARTVNALKRVIKKRFDDRVWMQIFFEATQDAIRGEIVQEIDARAGIFAHRLFMALAPFFQSNQINSWSHVNHPDDLKPLSEEHMRFVTAAPGDKPITRDFITRLEVDSNQKPLPGTTDFEKHLTSMFKKALQTRYKWEKNHDGDYGFDFPIFRQPFKEGHFLNEEHRSLADGSSKIIPTDFKERVWVCTMFGVTAEVRKPWTSTFHPRRPVTRPAVFNLD